MYLGNDLNVLAIVTKNSANVLDVLSPSDERRKHHVDIVLHAESEISLILLRQCGQIDIGVGQVDTLLGGNESVVASSDLDGLVVSDFEDIECKDTIVDVDHTALLDDLGNVLVVDIPEELTIRSLRLEAPKVGYSHVLRVARSSVLLIGGDVQDSASLELDIGIT